MLGRTGCKGCKKIGLLCKTRTQYIMSVIHRFLTKDRNGICGLGTKVLTVG